MRFRGTYLKVTDLEKALNFWQQILGVEPVEIHASYYEFKIENGALGISLNDYNDKYVPSSAGPVFVASSKEEAEAYIPHIHNLGGKMIFNGLADKELGTIVFIDPCGNEFGFKTLAEL
jgi:predicted enzyme related to lactoylglutathione lyase